MEVIKYKAIMKQRQPPVVAYQLTQANMKWIDANVTKAGLLPDGEGINLRNKFGLTRCHVGMIIIENSGGHHHTMSKENFDKLYDVTDTEGIEI